MVGLISLYHEIALNIYYVSGGQLQPSLVCTCAVGSAESSQNPHPQHPSQLIFKSGSQAPAV